MIKNTLEKYSTLKKRLILDGILVGLISGFFTLFYRFILSKIDVFRNYIYSKTDFLIILACIIVGLITTLFIGKLLIYAPLSGGSGIPQISAELQGEVSMNPKRTLIAKILGGSLGNLMGLSLGREGPSIQIGAASAKGLSKLLKRDLTEEKYIISAGASAGLAAAFNAPLSGTLFTLEEMHKNFSPLLLIPSLIAAVTADFLGKYVFGLEPVFSFKVTQAIELKYYWILLIIGIICGLIGVLFNKSILIGQDLFKKVPIKKEYKVVIPILCAILLAYNFNYLLGGGHFVVNHVITNKSSILFLLALVIGKLLFTSLSFGSGTQGGIFLPVLVIGGTTGALLLNIFSKANLITDIYFYNFVIIAMAGVLTSVVRSPILSILLVTEMTGSFSHILALSLVSIIAYLVAESLHSKPIYESLLDRLLDRKEKNDKLDANERVLTKFLVPINSKVNGKKIKDIKLPVKCLIVSIERNDEEILPNGDTILNQKDELTVVINPKDKLLFKELL